MKQKDLTRFAILILATAWIAGCASTDVTPGAQSSAKNLPRPQRILVYNFAVSDNDIKENQGIVNRVINDANGTTAAQREGDIGRQAADALAENLVAGLQEMGFTVSRVTRGTTPANGELLVDGLFLNVDEGNRLRRLVVGFGSGGSSVDTQVDVYYGMRRNKLLEFATHSDSGKLPGAAVSMGAGAAVSGGVTAGAAAATVASGGIKAYRTDTERMAARSGTEAVVHLSEYFAQQGWITPDQVKKAPIIP